MKVTIERGTLSINIHEIFDGLTSDELLEIADSISCTDQVIKNVADQIVYGYTELVSHGSKGSPESPNTPLQLAQAFIAENHMQITKDYIDSLRKLIRWKEEWLNREWEKQRELESDLSNHRRRIRELELELESLKGRKT